MMDTKMDMITVVMMISVVSTNKRGASNGSLFLFRTIYISCNEKNLYLRSNRGREQRPEHLAEEPK